MHCKLLCNEALPHMAGIRFFNKAATAFPNFSQQQETVEAYETCRSVIAGQSDTNDSGHTDNWGKTRDGDEGHTPDMYVCFCLSQRGGR